MIDSSRVIVQAEAMLRRISPRGRRLARRARRRRWRMFIRRLARAALAMLAVAFAAGMFGLLVFPLGTEGLMLAFVAMAVVAAIILFWPSAPDPTPETLMKTALAEIGIAHV